MPTPRSADSTPTRTIDGDLVEYANGAPRSSGISARALITAAEIEAAGDLLVGSARGAIGRLAVGRPGQVLTADPGGIAWRDASSGVSSLVSLTDVDIASPSVGEVLTWDGTHWINNAGGGGGASVLNDLLDVIVATPAVHQSLFWNGTHWVNRAPALTDVSDVSVTSPATGAVLSWNGTAWANGQINLGNPSSVTGTLALSSVGNLTGPSVAGRLTGTGPLTSVALSALSKALTPFTSGDIGGVPASGGGTLNFLRADGSWAAPPGGGGGGGTGNSYFPGGW